MDFRNVKSLTIPEGKVIKITSGGVVLWTAKGDEPTSAFVMVVDDLVASGKLTANGSAIGSDITLSNGITLYGGNICRTAANYNYADRHYSAAIRIVTAGSLNGSNGGGILLDITNYTTLTLIGRSSSANKPRNFRVGNQNATSMDSTTYTNYTDMLFHDPNAGSVTNAVTLAQYDLTTIKNDYGNIVKI